MLNSRMSLLSKRVNFNNCNPLKLVSFYSRKSNSNHDDSFKIVGRKGSENRDEVANASIGVNPNWELLTPQGFRFYLPGNTGTAWQDVYTSANISSHRHLDDSSALVCTVQECPILLRQGVYELFAGADMYGQLTVVTLSQRAKTRTTSSHGDVEAEQLTKQFVMAAQDICSKLKLSGYWADFINPFSGLPYVSASAAHSSKIYETDKRFRCLGFRIFEKNKCRVIVDKSKRHFVGSLFTTAPPSTALLQEILLDYED